MSAPTAAVSGIPDYIGFDCRVCSARLFAEPDKVGKPQRCEECGTITIVPPPPKPKSKNIPPALEGEQYELWEPDEQPLPSQILAAQSRLIAVECHKCNTMMYPTVKQVGEEIRCPDCGTRHIVPPPPRPAEKRSVLTPDARTPQLDPAADPGERPYIAAPVGKMLHETEQEAEYARALEKARRTGKPMEIDARGRPVMPRWPLVTGIIPFLFSPGVLTRWIGYSAISIAYDALGWIIVWAISHSESLYTLGISGILIAGFSAVGIVLLPIWLAGLASIFFAIVTESSEGNATVKTWPSANLTDWFPELFYVTVAIVLSAGPGSLLAPLLRHDSLLTTACVAGGVVLSFPIIVLSQLDIGSPFGVLSFRVVRSLIHCPLSWVVFYIETGTLVALCVLAAYIAEQTHIFFTVLFTPLFVMSVLLYGRLLGRLGWRLVVTMRIEVE